MKTNLMALLIAGTVITTACNSNKTEQTEVSTDTSAMNAGMDTMHTTNTDVSSSTSSALHTSMKAMMDKMQNMTMSGDFDMDFANMMIEHHQGAIDMSKIQVEQGTDAKLKEMAQKMITKQTAEINQLKAIISKYKPHGMKHGEGELMKSMSEMNQKMSSPMHGNTDRDFASMMIAHHEGAIKMSEMQVEHGMNADLKAIAKKAISEQKKEITELQNWLASK